MKRLVIGCIAVGLLASASMLTAEEKKEDPLKGIKCVVSGKDINPDATAEYKDGKVYFCCEGCPKAFEKNTKKFAAKANLQLVATKQYKQTKCPLSGKGAKDSVTVKVGTVKVGLCCKGCEKAAGKKKDDELVAFLFNDDSFKKGFAATK